jgi:hypothetical protein
VKFIKTSISILILAAGLSACDSSSSVDDPNKSYFLKFYGGDGDQTGSDLVVLPDGTFILFGTSTPTGSGSTSQWYLVKSDANGNLIWQKTFGNPNVDDEARDIELTSDGKIVAVGNTYVGSNNRDVRVMTLTLDGVPIDSAFIPIIDASHNVSNGDEDATSVTEISDGFMISGSTTYVPTHPPGNPTDPRDGLNIRIKRNLTPYGNGWPEMQTNGKKSDDVTNKIFEVADGSGFYLFGYSNAPKAGQNAENYNLWYYKLGPTGGIVGDNLLGAQVENEKPTSVGVSPSTLGGGYFQAGVSYNQAGAASLSVAMLRNTLSFVPVVGTTYYPDSVFIKSVSIPLGTTMNEHTAVFASAQFGFFVLANEKSFNDNQNWLLTRIGNDGSTIWSLPIVFGGEGPDNIGGIQELPDGRLVMVGTMRTGKSDTGEFKLTLIKVNQDGKLLN